MKYLSLTIFLISALIASASAQATKPLAEPRPPITELSVDVEGGKTTRLKAADISKLPRKEVRAKDHDGVDATYSGVELREILSAAGSKLGKDLRGPAIAQFLIIEAVDGYHAVYSLTELDPDFSDKIVILADTREGKPLSPENGTWQIIASGEKKHARWVRQVTALKVRLAK